MYICVNAFVYTCVCMSVCVCMRKTEGEYLCAYMHACVCCVCKSEKSLWASLLPACMSKSNSGL